MRRLAVLLAALVTALGVALGAAVPAASAGTLPKVQAAGMGGDWSGVWRVRPGYVAFGAHFFIKDLRYPGYWQRNAYAAGRLEIDTCQPNCVTGGHLVSANAHFWWVLYHRGPGRYFDHLELTWRGHKMFLWVNSRGEWWWRGA